MPATGLSAPWAQAELRKVLAAMGARVVEGEVALGHADTRFEADGSLADEQARGELSAVLDVLIAESRPQPVAVAA